MGMGNARLCVPGVPLRGFGWAAWAGHSNLSQHWGRRGASSHAVKHLQNPGSSGLPLKHWFISFFSTQWGSWTSHISQTKGGLRGTKVGSLMLTLCGASQDELQHLPALKLASACSPQEFRSWKPPSWLATAAPAPPIPSTVWCLRGESCPSPPFPALCVWGMQGSEGLQQPYPMNSSGYSLPPAEPCRTWPPEGVH